MKESLGKRLLGEGGVHYLVDRTEFCLLLSEVGGVVTDTKVDRYIRRDVRNKPTHLDSAIIQRLAKLYMQ